MLAAFSTVKKYNFHGFEALPAFCTDVPLWNPAGTHGIGCSSTNYSALEKSGKIGSFITCCDIMLPHSGNRSHASTKGARSGKTPCKMNWKLLESATILFFFPRISSVLKDLILSCALVLQGFTKFYVTGYTAVWLCFAWIELIELLECTHTRTMEVLLIGPSKNYLQVGFQNVQPPPLHQAFLNLTKEFAFNKRSVFSLAFWKSMPILLSYKSWRWAELGSGSVVNTSAFLWPRLPAYSAPQSNRLFHTLHKHNVSSKTDIHCTPHTAYIRTFLKPVMCLLPLDHSILLYANSQRNFAYNLKIILTKVSPVFPFWEHRPQQSLRARNIQWETCLGLELGASDQARGEIPNFPISKSSWNISLTSFSIPWEVSSAGLSSPVSLWRVMWVL